MSAVCMAAAVMAGLIALIAKAAPVNGEDIPNPGN